jgi:hypothetical protein
MLAIIQIKLRRRPGVAPSRNATNYEALKTVPSGWDTTSAHKVGFKSLNGGVFGDLRIAPGYAIAISYKTIELYSGRIFFDIARRANDFFYSWSELSAAPTD